MLRSRLEKATEWANEVGLENKELKQQRHWAYRTRDRAAEFLQQIADVHWMRSDGSCKCSAKNCRVAKVLNNGLARKLIADADKAQDHVRWLQQTAELRYLDMDEDEDYTWASPPGQARRRDDTA